MPGYLSRPESWSGLWGALAEGRIEVELGGDGRSYTLQKLGDSPCHAACPAGVDVKGYVGLVAQKRFQEAVDLVRESCPLPGICGRVCTHPCELACQRGETDAPVAIRLLKRFVADWEEAHPKTGTRKAPRLFDEKVAVIGGGPAGLTAAFDLVRMGYGVTVFEAEAEPGGMLEQCIPTFRLPREVIRSEVAHIADLGVEFKNGVRVGRDITLAQIREQGYAAIVLALGTQFGKKLGVPGEELDGASDALEFLRRVNSGGELPKGRSLLVVGGGMSAMDVARTARRLGLDTTVVYRRTKDEMPAVREEVEDAEREGVKFRFLAAPLAVTGEGGKMTGMACQVMKLGEPDESGRRRPVPVEGETFALSADFVVAAISQEADLSLLGGDAAYKTTRWGSLEADPETLATSVPGVFAAGDVVMGPDTVIGAIAQGHKAARSAHAFLRGEALPLPAAPAPFEMGIMPREPKKQARVPQPVLDPGERQGFDEVELGYAEEAAVAEALRCNRCGPCKECLSCAGDCRHRIALLRTRTELEAGGLALEPVLLRVPTDSDDFPLLKEDLNLTLRWSERSNGSSVRREESFTLSPLVSRVIPKLCRACGDCVRACPYDAIRVVESPGGPGQARVYPEFCKGCGACVAVCPTQAMTLDHFEHDHLLDQVEALMTQAAADGDAPRILFLSCNWCFPLDEGFARRLPEGVKVMDVLCTGRIHPALVMHAFEHGADGVFIAGCVEGECHYRSGNQVFMPQAGRLRGILQLLGVAPERFNLSLLPRGQHMELPKNLGQFADRLGRLGPLETPGKTDETVEVGS